MLLLVGSVINVGADRQLDDYLENALRDLEDFRDRELDALASFRDSVMKEMQEWARAPWVEKPTRQPVEPPNEFPPVPPEVIPPGVPAPKPEEKPIVLNPDITPAPAPPPPAPTPIMPPPAPEPKPDAFDFSSYGSRYCVDADPALLKAMPPASVTDAQAAIKKSIGRIDADLLARLSSSLSDEASKRRLSDWAYFKLTRHFTESFLPGNVNAQRFMQGMLLLSAGYDIRFANIAGRDRLYLLIGCRDIICYEQAFQIDNELFYYPFEKLPERSISVLSESFNGTQPLCVHPSGKEQFDHRPGKMREITICIHEPHCIANHCHTPTLSLRYYCNLNRMDFYADCPRCYEPGDGNTTWNSYAMSQLSDDCERQLYPVLRESMKEMSQLQSVNFLMKFVEAFDYKLDSEMWGVTDRIFFPEETLHYPFRDCEDGAILLTRLVKDLTGLPTALVYYPGKHLSAAVAFEEAVEGAYFIHNGKKYTECDPTYYYADAGMRMPSMKSTEARIILLGDK